MVRHLADARWLPLVKAADRLACGLPFGHPGVDLAGCLAALQQVKQALQGVAPTLRDDLHAAVGAIGREPGQAEFERPRPGPPAETHALDIALHPGGEPDVRFAHRYSPPRN